MDSNWHFSASLLYIVLILLSTSKGISGTTFTLTNRCSYTVWPGILSNAGSTPLDSTGFELPPGGTRSFQSPPTWSGRFWGRTGCTFDPATNQGTCLTGDCGSNQLECNGLNAKPPATLAEFTVGSNSQDFYDVSLVDGYNLPITVEPNGGSGNCLSTGCITDINRSCPSELRVGSGDACKSACEAFGNDEYCCSGEYSTPEVCKPSVYSEMFKLACPKAYSYAYDDSTSTFTCTGADYVITFCPSSASQKSLTGSIPTTSSTPATASTTTRSGSGSDSGSSSQTGSGDESSGVTSWLPNFLTGRNSSNALSCSAWSLRLIVSAISFLLIFHY